jgi:hypothetical protein
MNYSANSLANVKAMSLFAIDMGEKKTLYSDSASGCEREKIIENLAAGI